MTDDESLIKKMGFVHPILGMAQEVFRGTLPEHLSIFAN